MEAIPPLFVPKPKKHVLCVKSILFGSKPPKSLIHGNGIVAIHNPRIAATKIFVQKGRRRIYERMRAGLNCGSEDMDGIVARTRHGRE